MAAASPLFLDVKAVDQGSLDRERDVLKEQARAVAFAERYGIPVVQASYDALLANPDIDAVYNPLPNSLHGPWTLKALAAMGGVDNDGLEDDFLQSMIPKLDAETLAPAQWKDEVPEQATT